MTMLSRTAAACALSLAAFLPLAAGAQNQTPEQFYKGKTLTLGIGSGVGGSHDVNGKLIARHLGKHVPGNPTVVPQNVPGAASLPLANHINEGAPKDGTYIALFNRAGIFDKIYDAKSAATFDPTKFNWLGSTDKIWSVAYVWHTAKAKKAEDLTSNEVIVGASGGSTDQIPVLLNEFAGFKFKIVRGYKSGGDVDLAVERGEVEGRASTTWAELKKRPWLSEKKATVLFWNGLEKHRDLPSAPLGIDFIKKPEDKKLMELYFAADELGYPMAAPPGTPADRVAALRKALADTFKDPAYIEEAKKLEFDVNPVSAERMSKIVSDAYATPADLQKRLQAIVTN
jgi:tripartite-type tricarboxylate transporter receptor subunit TctC